MSASFQQRLERAVQTAGSLVCVGLDPESSRLPRGIASEPEPFFAFNREIIDATAGLVCAFKFQIAHYAAEGRERELEKSIAHVHERHPLIPVILDAKRSDIGSTAERYAVECFRRFNADAVTINPYLGSDGVLPFSEHADRGVFVLCRTSNASAREIQDLRVGDRRVFEIVAELALTSWNRNGNIGLVVGATYPDDLALLRRTHGDRAWFLVPGVGAQGGDVRQVVPSGQTSAGTGLLINSSRQIIYASHGSDFASKARAAAESLRGEINAVRRS